MTVNSCSLKTYVVKRGDCISTIALKYKTTVDTIKVLNPNLKDVDKINVGDKLIISSSQNKENKKAENPYNKNFHIVQNGDNPTKIAQKYGISLNKLLELNPGLKPKKLFVGQKIYLSENAPKADFNFGELTTIPKAETIKKQNEVKFPIEYSIKSGDSIEKLARKYNPDPRIQLGERVKQILEANNLTSKSILHKGQKIVIPEFKYTPKLQPIDTSDKKFENDIDFIFSVEGGINSKNAKIDRGGLTNMGITQATYTQYQKDKAFDANIGKLATYKSVEVITKEEAKEIYYNYYYKQTGAYKIKDDKLRLAYLDTAVNCGGNNAKKMLQQSNGDVNKFYDLRIQHYDTIIKNDPTQQKFQDGWYNRIEELRTYYN